MPRRLSVASEKYKDGFDKPIHVCCWYWLPDRWWWPDLIGLLQATSDILETAGRFSYLLRKKGIDKYRPVIVNMIKPSAVMSISNLKLTLLI